MVKHSRSMMMITLLLPLLVALIVITFTVSNVDAAAGNSSMVDMIFKGKAVQMRGSSDKCEQKISEELNGCFLKYGLNPLDPNVGKCEKVYKVNLCGAEIACSDCDSDDAIAFEKHCREVLSDFLKNPEAKCTKYKPPKSLDKPFCTPSDSSGIPVWAIIIIVLVVFGCCCGVIGIGVYCFCFADDDGHPNRSGSGHSGKNAHHSGGKGGKHSSKTGKRHSSKGRHSSSHQSHN